MTTDRFYGGVSNRLENLRSMFKYIRVHHPSREQLVDWVLSNTPAGSSDAVNHHLAFLASVELIDLTDEECTLAEYGEQWLQTQESKTLYRALSEGVKGFDTILTALSEEPMTDEEFMALLTSTFDEAEMSTPGPAIRHREWLQVLGYLTREDGVNRLTDEGEALVAAKGGNSDTLQSMWAPPDGISVGDTLTQEEIEEAFDTGFGYRISGINPRRDSNDHRYVLVFAREDGPYDDSVRDGAFEYIGEGLSGDQSETSPGNATLIDAASSDIPVHFFYQDATEGEWEYQGLVDVCDYEFREQDGREVLVFKMEHQDVAGINRTDLGDGSLTAELATFEEALGEELDLHAADESYTEVRQRIRDAVFRRLVRQVYDETCAICGQRRETPNGNPEVEAAHIYPKEDSSPDVVQNGLALCKLHHWAFDNGWLSVSDDYEILVKEAPDRDGYYEFKQLEGKRLKLPDNDAVMPAPMYLEQHRELKGF